MRADADLDYTVAELVDGAFFNSGQSCSTIEVRFDSFPRLHLQLTPNRANLRTRNDQFVAKFVDITKVGRTPSQQL